MARTLESYAKEQAILNKVLESEKGLVAKFATAREARSFSVNCYGFRKLDRDAQSQGLEPLDPKRGRSPYDLIKFELVTNYKTGDFRVTMRNCKTVLQAHGVESLIDLATEESVEVSLSPPALLEEAEILIEPEGTGSLESEMQDELNKEDPQ